MKSDEIAAPGDFGSRVISTDDVAKLTLEYRQHAINGGRKFFQEAAGRFMPPSVCRQK
jgi:hypothetical protein